MKTPPVVLTANWHLSLLFVIGVPMLCASVFVLLQSAPPAFGEAATTLGTVSSSTPSVPEVVRLPSVDSIVFLGDVMLARNVEFLARQNGLSYPFLNFPSIVGSSQTVVANFEASIARVHRRTPSGVMRFSVDTALLAPLAESGVTHASLANNHTFDYGAVDYSHTKDELFTAGIQSFGHPTVVSSSSVTYLSQGPYRIAVIAIHTLFAAVNQADLAAAIETAAADSDMQIAYVHWGDEYASSHNQAQVALAIRLADLGVDAIIGHHPHVTQDVQLVAGIPVFYSLGNVIFDQYFSDQVQEGYALSLAIELDTLTYTLIPITSIGTRSQPRPMVGSERDQFLVALADKSDMSLQADIKQGKVIFPFSLATSSKNSIIAP